ncbi:MAG TPA: FCD domain-containing protein [Anaerolineales bacterium]|nr:FCD domain-containing protein [Anaerolineales bacterium]
MNRRSEKGSEFLDYLLSEPRPAGTRLPSINDLATVLGISPSKLREQLEVARALGLVEVRPKTGIRTREFSPLPALRLAILYGVATDGAWFEALRDLRTRLETTYWEEAVTLLEEADLQRLEALIEQGWAKLQGNPVQIPHAEHRALHVGVFARLPNPMARALLESYWEAYEAVGLGLYADYEYLRQVWTYHRSMVEAIRAGNLEAGKRAFVEHTGLLRTRPQPAEMSMSGAPPPAFPGNWRGDLG